MSDLLRNIACSRTSSHKSSRNPEAFQQEAQNRWNTLSRVGGNYPQPLLRCRGSVQRQEQKQFAGLFGPWAHMWGALFLAPTLRRACALLACDVRYVCVFFPRFPGRLGRCSSAMLHAESERHMLTWQMRGGGVDGSTLAMTMQTMLLVKSPYLTAAAARV